MINLHIFLFRIQRCKNLSTLQDSRKHPTNDVPLRSVVMRLREFLKQSFRPGLAKTGIYAGLPSNHLFQKPCSFHCIFFVIPTTGFPQKPVPALPLGWSCDLPKSQPGYILGKNKKPKQCLKQLSVEVDTYIYIFGKSSNNR